MPIDIPGVRVEHAPNALDLVADTYPKYAVLVVDGYVDTFLSANHTQVSVGVVNMLWRCVSVPIDDNEHRSGVGSVMVQFNLLWQIVAWQYVFEARDVSKLMSIFSSDKDSAVNGVHGAVGVRAYH